MAEVRETSLPSRSSYESDDRKSNDDNNGATLDDELMEILKVVFPSHHKRYEAVLAAHDLVSCNAVLSVKVDELVEVGFTKMAARMLLNRCNATTIAVCINEDVRIVGHIRARSLAYLSQVRKVIVRAKIPGVFLNFLFAHRGHPVTEQQETSWQVEEILTKDNGIVLVDAGEGQKDVSGTLNERLTFICRCRGDNSASSLC